jgi:hypothetical protein
MRQRYASFRTDGRPLLVRTSRSPLGSATNGEEATYTLYTLPNGPRAMAEILTRCLRRDVIRRRAAGPS